VPQQSGWLAGWSMPLSTGEAYLLQGNKSSQDAPGNPLSDSRPPFLRPGLQSLHGTARGAANGFKRVAQQWTEASGPYAPCLSFFPPGFCFPPLAHHPFCRKERNGEICPYSFLRLSMPIAWVPRRAHLMAVERVLGRVSFGNHCAI